MPDSRSSLPSTHSPPGASPRSPCTTVGRFGAVPVTRSCRCRGLEVQLAPSFTVTGPRIRATDADAGALQMWASMQDPRPSVPSTRGFATTSLALQPAGAPASHHLGPKETKPLFLGQTLASLGPAPIRALAMSIATISARHSKTYSAWPSSTGGIC